MRCIDSTILGACLPYFTSLYRKEESKLKSITLVKVSKNE